MTPQSLSQQYGDRFRAVLEPLALRLHNHIASCLSHCERIERITARAKSPERFLKKSEKMEGGHPKYSDPINQIQDQVGARIITFYLADVDLIATEVERYFRAIEARVIVPDSDSEFGYFGKHYILLVPSDVIHDGDEDQCPRFFELQIKTLFQHAWSEAEHDLGYKPMAELSSEQKRMVAFTAAQAWGADQIFEQLRVELTTP